MLTMEIMTRDVVTVSPETCVVDSYDLMKKHRIRNLPVVEADGALVGIVTDRDVRQVLVPLSMDGPSFGFTKRGGRARARLLREGKGVTFSPKRGDCR